MEYVVWCWFWEIWANHGTYIGRKLMMTMMIVVVAVVVVVDEFDTLVFQQHQSLTLDVKNLSNRIVEQLHHDHQYSLIWALA